MGSKAPSQSLVQPPLYTLPEDGPRAPIKTRVVKVGVIGVDISKDKLTIYCEGSTSELSNEEKGFQELLNRELHAALTRKLAVNSWAVWYYNGPFDYSPRD